MNNDPSRRKSKRVLVDFVLEVSANDIDGNKYNDNAVLSDVSGGGAKLITKQSDKYFLGQPLEITIYLPGTNDVKAYITGQATVVRIYLPKAPDAGEEGKGMGVAISFDDPLKMHNE
ncbi:MAG: PilZ domain-containing protein [Syntrophales bacterium]|nr:PilZ domain-containing protein [Syntrophales bacterium]